MSLLGLLLLGNYLYAQISQTCNSPEYNKQNRQLSTCNTTPLRTEHSYNTACIHHNIYRFSLHVNCNLAQSMTWAVSFCIVLHSCSSASCLYQLQQFLRYQSIGSASSANLLNICSISSGGPQCTTLCTALQSMPIPKAFVQISTLRQLSPFCICFSLFHTGCGNTCVHVHKAEVWYVRSTDWMCEFTSKLLTKEFIDARTITSCPTEDQYSWVRYSLNS